MSSRDRRNYFTYTSRVYSHYDWFLREALVATGTSSWTMEEILLAMKAHTGVQPQEDKLLRHLTRRFAEQQSAPLRRVGQDRYVIDTDYYRLLAAEIHSPRPGQRGPRPKICSTAETNVKSLLKAPGVEKRRKRRHQKYYCRLIKYPERVLAQIFDGEQELDVQAITEGIHQQFDDISFKSTTVERLLSKYVELARGPPYLERPQPGVYRIRGPRGTNSDYEPLRPQHL